LFLDSGSIEGVFDGLVDGKGTGVGEIQLKVSVITAVYRKMYGFGEYRLTTEGIND
jgi:hypothetical protein